MLNQASMIAAVLEIPKYASTIDKCLYYVSKYLA